MRDVSVLSHDATDHSFEHDEDAEEVDIVGSGDEEYSDESDDEELIHRAPRDSRYDVAFIFELLWRNRKLSSGAPEEGLNIWLPETIVFRHSHPTGWYFTNTSDGRIMKRMNGQEHFISQKKILEVFDGASGEVIAIFINTHDLDGKRVAGNIQYFDRQHLREFLYTEDPNRNGFLQKFISIKQQQYSNSQIQTLHVNWTRGVLVSTNVENRANNLRITRKEAEHASPCSYSFAKAELRTSTQLPVQSSLLLKIQASCERIADHVHAVTEGRVRINHLIAYFRVGHKGIVWFNFCTSADVQEIPPESTRGLHAHPRYKGSRIAASLASGINSPSFGSAESSHSRARSAEPHVVTRTRSTEEKEAALAADMQRRLAEENAPPCPLCEEKVGLETCSYSTVMRAMCNWMYRFERASKELHRPYPVGKSILFPPAVHYKSLVLSLWYRMKLREEDRVSLPQLRALLLSVGLEQASVNTIEVAIAEADAHLAGFINKRLFTRAVSAVWGKRSEPPPDVVAASQDAILPRGAHPLEATGDAGPPLLPRIQHALQAVMSRKDYQRILPPAQAARENPNWTNRTVPCCTKCQHSLGLLANDSQMSYWDDKLETLFSRVSLEHPIPAHYAHTATFSYTHTAARTIDPPPSGGTPRTPRPPLGFKAPTLTRLEREWIRKRKAGELPGGAHKTPISPGAHLPSLGLSPPANRPSYTWSPGASLSHRGRTASPRGAPAIALSDEELLAELARRGLAGEPASLGPPMIVAGQIGALHLPTPPRSARRVASGDSLGAEIDELGAAAQRLRVMAERHSAQKGAQEQLIATLRESVAEADPDWLADHRTLVDSAVSLPAGDAEEFSDSPTGKAGSPTLVREIGKISKHLQRLKVMTGRQAEQSEAQEKAIAALREKVAAIQGACEAP